VETADYLLDRPPGGWESLATKQDLDALAERMDLRFEDIDRRFEEVHRHFDEVHRHFDAIDRRFVEIDRRFEEVHRHYVEIDRRFDEVDRHFADVQQTVRGEIGRVLEAVDGRIAAAFATQLRWVVGTMIAFFAVFVALLKL